MYNGQRAVRIGKIVNDQLLRCHRWLNVEPSVLQSKKHAISGKLNLATQKKSFSSKSRYNNWLIAKLINVFVDVEERREVSLALYQARHGSKCKWWIIH